MKNWVSLLLLLLSAVLAPASYQDGYAEDGYTYHASDGHWWQGGYPYSREKVTYQHWVSSCYGGYYQPYYYYTYTQLPKVVSYTDPDWRSQLLGIAAKRDEFEGQLRRSASEHNQFIEAVSALGLHGNFAWQGYGLAPTLAYPTRSYQQNVQLGNYGASGNSLYGYSYSQLTDAYGATDPGLLYQQAAALAKNSQDLGGQATTQFSGLVEQAGSQKARVAEILAKGQSAALALQASNAQSSVQTQVSGTVVGTAVGVAAGTAVGTAAGTAALSPGQQAAITACVRCHTGDKPKGSYDVTRHWQLSREDQLHVVERLLLDPSDAKHMPKGETGQPGPRLSPALIAEFFPARMGK